MGVLHMDITFLGTGAGIPSKERNVTSIILDMLQEINELWMFDCGEATQHQILHTTLKPRKIKKIFITHLHGDHIFGLPGLLSSRSFLGGDDEVIVYGPKGIKNFIETSLLVSETHLAYDIDIVEFDEPCLLIDEESYVVETILLDHNMKSFGYKITEKDKIGELQVDKLREIGITPGPIYKQIKENERVTLDDGTILYRKDFIGDAKKGRKVVILGDTRYVSSLPDFVKGADLLIHEATFSKENPELAKQYYHSTTKDAATIAKKGNVQHLILTHISSRYQKEHIPLLLEEAMEIFPNVTIAYDFYQYTIK